MEGDLRSQAEIWKYMFGFTDSMALRCAVELRIADIINSHSDGSISLAQIASGISGSDLPPDMACLGHIMRLLVRRNIFSAHRPSGGDTLYGLTNSSRWLLRDESGLSLAPLVLLETNSLLMYPWHRLGECVRRGGVPFERDHGKEIWKLASQDPEFNKVFNEAMECSAKFMIRAVLEEYKQGFRGLRSVVDVGGGTGTAVAEIVKSQPNIVGINYDLPHVIATAPEYPGVSHVGGDMFESVPNADAVFIKWILHCWSDEHCVKILKNCRRAIQEKGGKVIIMDVVLDQEGNGPFVDVASALNLAMVAYTSGKERTEAEWKYVLEEAGFPRYNIIKIPALLSIIEAYPE